MAAVFIDDDGERLEKLAGHLAPDFVSISPQTVLPAILRRTSAVDVHHAHFQRAE